MAIRAPGGRRRGGGSRAVGLCAWRRMRWGSVHGGESYALRRKRRKYSAVVSAGRCGRQGRGSPSGAATYDGGDVIVPSDRRYEGGATTENFVTLTLFLVVEIENVKKGYP